MWRETSYIGWDRISEPELGPDIAFQLQGIVTGLLEPVGIIIDCCFRGWGESDSPTPNQGQSQPPLTHSYSSWPVGPSECPLFCRSRKRIPETSSKSTSGVVLYPRLRFTCICFQSVFLRRYSLSASYLLPTETPVPSLRGPAD